MRVLLVIAAVTYSGLPWEAVAGFPLDASRSYLSELAAADRPSGWLFRSLDITTGLLILAALAGVPRRLRPVGLARGAEFALAAFAFLTIVDASSPMACASSASLECARADAANALGLGHQIHTVSSAGALAAVLVSAVLLSVSALRGEPRTRPLERRLLVGVVGLLAAVTLIVSVLALVSTGDGRLVDGGGLVQRAQVLLVSTYLCAYAVIAGRRRSESAPAVRMNATSTR
jgi:hypothetical protein